MSTCCDGLFAFYNDLRNQGLLGGRVNGGIYGTAPSLNPDSANPAIENNASDVRIETGFRSVYTRILDGWLGGDSRAILGADFRNTALTFV